MFNNKNGNLLSKEWFDSYWDANHFEEELLNISNYKHVNEKDIL